MSEIKIFKNDQFGQVRTSIDKEGEPLFCLSDVCKVLDLGNVSQVKCRLSDGVISSEGIVDSLGRVQVASFINEDGLYDVMLDSRKPEAKQFRKWVTSEVLPSLRKDGGYVVAEENDDEVMILARGMVAAGKAIERKDKQIAEANKTIAIKEAIIERTSWLTMSQLCQIKGLPNNVPEILSLLSSGKVIEKIIDKNTCKGYRIVSQDMTGVMKCDVKYLDNNTVGYSKIVVNPEKISTFINKLNKIKQNVKIN